jgi:hypothetical protein
MTITVSEVFKSLGIDPDPRTAWAVGQRIQAMFRDRNGRQPPKENRPKTRGPGTHCMAIYSGHWRRRIESVIREEAAAELKRAAAQARLF